MPYAKNRFSIPQRQGYSAVCKRTIIRIIHFSVKDRFFSQTDSFFDPEVKKLPRESPLCLTDIFRKFLF